MSGKEAWSILKNVPAAWKVGVIILSALFTLAAYAQDLRDLPDTVRDNTKRIERVENMQEQILDAVRLSNCLDMQEAVGGPYQLCLNQD